MSPRLMPVQDMFIPTWYQGSIAALKPFIEVFYHLIRSIHHGVLCLMQNMQSGVIKNLLSHLVKILMEQSLKTEHLSQH